MIKNIFLIVLHVFNRWIFLIAFFSQFEVISGGVAVARVAQDNPSAINFWKKANNLQSIFWKKENNNNNNNRVINIEFKFCLVYHLLLSSAYYSYWMDITIASTLLSILLGVFRTSTNSKANWGIKNVTLHNYWFCCYLKNFAMRIQLFHWQAKIYYQYCRQSDNVIHNVWVWNVFIIETSLSCLHSLLLASWMHVEIVHMLVESTNA
jgi:hypothetical protein